MGGWPNDPEAKKCIRVLEKEFRWSYSTDVGNSAHHTGLLMCERGCLIKVNGTGKNTARALWNLAKKCTHGRAPNRRQW